jgi:hypothetical protein
MGEPVPKLFVEGKDDVSVVNALLTRHGVDTECGKKHLFIQYSRNVDGVLDSIPEAIKVSTDRPVGFVVDIDIEIANRWGAVCAKLREAEFDDIPAQCPLGGFFGRMPGYPCQFGVWLMPDCQTNYAKMEHLIQSLIRQGDPVWEYAKTAVAEAARLITVANEQRQPGTPEWDRYRDVDCIKAEVHTWIAWQKYPGAPLGAAVNDYILGHDSAQARSFLLWLKQLYGLNQLALPAA